MQKSSIDETEETSTQESSLQGPSPDDASEQAVPSVPVVLSLPESEDMMRVSWYFSKYYKVYILLNGLHLKLVTNEQWKKSH